MKNLFEVSRSYEVDNYIAFEGRLLQGIITDGMKILVKLNNNLNIYGSISKVRPYGENYSLYIKCEDKEEIELWEMLNIVNERIEIV